TLMPAPLWLKLSKQGDTVTGAVSTDGATWETRFVETIANSPTVWLGLAVRGVVDSRVARPRATFEEVRVGRAPRPELFLGHGLLTTYFDGGELSVPRFRRVEPGVNVSWVTPPDSSLGTSDYSVRWTGMVVPEQTESIRFYLHSTGGGRLWIDGQLLVDDWGSHAARERNGVLSLQAGQAYKVRVELRSLGAAATARLSWSSASLSKAVIPPDRLCPQDESMASLAR